MARTEIVLADLSAGNGAVQAAFVAVDQTNGMRIANAGKYRNVLIVVRNTNGTARVATLAAGRSTLPNPQASALSVAATTGEGYLFPESDKHEQADESVYLDFAASFAGTVAAFILPDFH